MGVCSTFSSYFTAYTCVSSILISRFHSLDYSFFFVRLCTAFPFEDKLRKLFNTKLIVVVVTYLGSRVGGE